jgi:hypothetical protein
LGGLCGRPFFVGLEGVRSINQRFAQIQFIVVVRASAEYRSGASGSSSHESRRSAAMASSAPRAKRMRLTPPDHTCMNRTRFDHGGTWVVVPVGVVVSLECLLVPVPDALLRTLGDTAAGHRCSVGFVQMGAAAIEPISTIQVAAFRLIPTKDLEPELEP